MPPGFLLECEVAFNLLKSNQPYLDNGYIVLAQRENSLGSLVEKKRSEYSSARARFEDLFSDAALEFLRSASPRFVRRITRIGLTATENWEKGPDGAPTWDRLKELLSPETIELLRMAPRQLLDKNTALIWPALAPLLNDETLRNDGAIRHALQNNYFSLYIDEYDLVVLRDIPHFVDEFNLPSPSRQYSFSYLGTTLRQLGLEKLLDADANTVINFRQRAGFIRMCDAISQVFANVTSETTLRSVVATAAQKARFEWWKGALLWENSPMCSLRFSMSSQHIAEVADGLDELAVSLEEQFELTPRSVAIAPASPDSADSVASRPVFVSNQGRRQMRTVVLATANPREFEAVLESMRVESTRLDRALEFEPSGILPRYSGALEGATGILHAYVVRADETGGDEAVDLLRRIRNELKPDCIFFVGCAALLDEKVRVDKNLVFVAKRAIDSDKREDTPDGTIYDMEQHHGEHHVTEEH